MTNTKFRKKALLASVAMLLVAMLALGSATFAWFAVQANTATAASINMTTKASTGIKILSASEAAIFGDTEDAGKLVGTYYAQSGVKLDAVKTAGWIADTASTHTRDNIATQAAGGHVITTPIIPDSANLGALVEGANWYTAGGTDANTPGRATNFSAGTTLGDGKSYSERIYIMQTESTGTEKVKSITVNWSGDIAISPSMRVAVFAQDQTLLGIWSAAGNDIKAYDATATEAGLVTTLDTKVAAKGSPININPASSGTYVTSTGLVVDGGAGNTYVTVVIYMDGEASTTTSNNALNAGTDAILSGLTVSFSII